MFPDRMDNALAKCRLQCGNQRQSHLTGSCSETHPRPWPISGLGSEVCHEVRKQITLEPIPLVLTRYQPFFFGRGALDSGPVLPIGCRAADDKVKPHNDVTYLKVLQINIERVIPDSQSNKACPGKREGVEYSL